jgi:hypothetical protein
MRDGGEKDWTSVYRIRLVVVHLPTLQQEKPTQEKQHRHSTGTGTLSNPPTTPSNTASKSSQPSRPKAGSVGVSRCVFCSVLSCPEPGACIFLCTTQCIVSSRPVRGDACTTGRCADGKRKVRSQRAVEGMRKSEIENCESTHIQCSSRGKPTKRVPRPWVIVGIDKTQYRAT